MRLESKVRRTIMIGERLMIKGRFVSILMGIAFALIVAPGIVEPVAAQSSCVPSPGGIVAWWPGDGNANDIVGGNDGTLTGGVTFGTGVVGDAFSFDGGGGFVEIPDSPSLNLTASLSAEAWVKPNRVA